MAESAESQGPAEDHQPNLASPNGDTKRKRSESPRQETAVANGANDQNKDVDMTPVDREQPSRIHRPRGPLSDPRGQQVLATFRQFNQWLELSNGDAEITDERARKEYQMYRKDMFAKFAPDYVRRNQSRPWFRERYLESEQSRRHEEQLMHISYLFKEWNTRFEQGEYSNLSLQKSPEEEVQPGLTLMGIDSETSFMERDVDPDFSLPRSAGNVQPLKPCFASADLVQGLVDSAIKIAQKTELSFDSQANGLEKILKHIQAKESALANNDNEQGNQSEQQKDDEGRNLISSEAELKFHLLDLITVYLWSVFRFDFYRLAFHHSPNPPEYLWRRDGRTSTLSSEDILDYEIFRDRVALSLDPKGYNSHSPNLLSDEDQVNKSLKGHIQFESEGKFRCRVGDCAKLFMGPEFVEKHITKKHPEFFEAIQEWAALLRQYACDAGRIMPPAFRTTDAAAKGTRSALVPPSMPSMWQGAPSGPKAAFDPRRRSGGLQGRYRHSPYERTQPRPHVYRDPDAIHKNDVSELDY